jgi:regulator of sigma E protease
LAQRAAIVFAGPAVNYLFAVAVFAALAVFQGTATPLAVVGEVMPDSAAAEAGLAKNDKILAIDGTEISLFSELRDKVMANPGRSLRFDVVRDGNVVALNAVPKSADRADDEGNTKTIGLLGVRPNLEHVAYERHNPAMALWVGVQQTATMTVNILVYVRDMIMGTRATDDLGGPLRIAQISGDMAQGGISKLVLLMAMLSVNLGLINLFPIPMLDGGHLAFYAAEAIRGKPLGPKVQEYGFRFGLILVLLLVVFVTWNDLVHLRVFEFIKDLFT